MDKDQVIMQRDQNLSNNSQHMSEQDEIKSSSILVVEDHEGLRGTMCTWLAELFPASAISTAVTGEEAVALAGRMAPDLILMDIRLPGISGIESMKEIFSRGIRSKVVVITNHDEEIYRQEAIKTGAMHFILKRNMWTSLPGIIKELLP